MSFQGLISGAECATPFNPLSQVLKHTEGDRSLQQDRVVRPSSSRLHHLPGTSTTRPNEQDLAHARQFFDGGAPPQQQNHNQLPINFASRPVMSLEEVRAGPSEHWTMEQRMHPGPAGAQSRAWADEFKPGTPIQQHPGPSSSSQSLNHDARQNSYMPMMSPNSQYGMMNMSMATPPLYQSYSNNFSSPSLEHLQSATGKGKGKQVDFEAAFAQVAASLDQQQSSARIVEVKDGDEVGDVTNTLKGVSFDEKTESFEDFLARAPEEGPPEDVAGWESQFHQMMAAQREESDQDYTGLMQDAWDRGASQDPLGENAIKFDDDGTPILGEYVFEQSNPYLGKTRSPLSEAKALLEQNGSLTEAALLLEAAIQQGELGEGGYEAWILLGETRNMDEREGAGMKALAEGVRRSEAAGAGGAGMLSLAISYTNESYDRASYNTLLHWIRARFPEHPTSDSEMQSIKSHSTWDSQERITHIFLQLAREQHAKGVIDPDVQIGLGVLFYTNQGYDKAKDCFEAALSMRPNDYLLWNRLGSCLSNGSKPEEALGAYRQALNIRPTYTRAVYNVGVACLNIGAHKEAAEHFLSALALQQETSDTAGGGHGAETSEQLWFTLRRALLLMDRSDLAGMAKLESKTPLDVFRREGFDF